MRTFLIKFLFSFKSNKLFSKTINSVIFSIIQEINFFKFKLNTLGNLTYLNSTENKINRDTFISLNISKCFNNSTKIPRHFCRKAFVLSCARRDEGIYAVNIY